MNFLKSLLPRYTRRSRLIFWFLLISLLPLIWMTIISYHSAKQMLISQARENLQSLNFRQAESIENYFREKEKDTLAIAKGFFVANSLEKISKALTTDGLQSEKYKQVENEFKDIITFKAEMMGYKNLFLVSKNGEVVFSVYPSSLVGMNLFSDNFENNQLRYTFENSINSFETKVSALTYYHPDEPPSSFISTPVLKDGILIGALVVQIDNKEIYELITNYNGLAETGETIIVSEIGSLLISLSPLRNNEESNFLQIIPEKTPFGIFAKHILNGERLNEEVVDYQGNNTIAVGRYLLPNLDWGLITKINIKELIIPIHKLAMTFLSMALAIALMVTLAAIYIADSLVKPVLVLTKKTRLMAAGDLSQRIDLKEGEEEIMALAQSFNEMATQLNNMIQHLDSIVAKRTEEVELQNIALEDAIQELQQTQNRLINQEKLASLGALTAGIAHEIKNPLNFINNFAELALQIDKDMEEEIDKIKNKIPTEDAEILHDYLETLKLNINKIYEHGKRADSIVRNMLQHSKGSKGEMVLTDINSILNEYLTLSYHGMRAQNPSFNVKLEKNLDPNLPKILVVPQEISRVFLNILSNAYYSVNEKQKQGDSTYAPTVSVSTKYEKNRIIIKIRDNGMGIPLDVYNKLFTPFFTTKPAGEGTGLGLSLSYNIIVQGHQGSLTAATQVNEFAEFTITLPARTIK